MKHAHGNKHQRAVMLGMAVALLLIIVAPSVRKTREEAFQEA